jgi:hypothetical protein
MKQPTFGNTARNFLSVFAGAAAGIACFMYFFTVSLFGWTDGGTKEEIARVEYTFMLFLLMMMAISSFVAGYVTARIATRKLAYAGATGVLLIIILLLAGDAFVSRLVDILFIAVFSLTGGWMASLRKGVKKHSAI